MNRETVNTICRSLTGAEWSDPSGGGHNAWKVGGRMFACIGSRGAGVSVKTGSIEEAEALIGMERAEKAPCFHRSWVLVNCEKVPEDALRERVQKSYGLVFDRLTKKAQSSILNG